MTHINMSVSLYVFMYISHMHILTENKKYKNEKSQDWTDGSVVTIACCSCAHTLPYNFV